MTLKLNTIFISKNQNTRLYNMTCPVVGLTGGIATGKSSVSRFLKNKSLAVICADELVKSIYKAPESIKFIKEQFPEAINNNKIDFIVLRERVFNNNSDKTTIENFIYSKLPDVFKLKAQSFNRPTIIIYDVPLLFEKGLDDLVDISICVYCPEEIQKQRLISRDNISQDLALKILRSQLDIEEKKTRSDFFINNSGQEKDLSKKIEEVLAIISE